MRPSPHSAGFTLLEVMTTVAIVSLLLVMVYSSWRSVLDASENSLLAAQNTHRERMTLQALNEVFSGVAWYEHHASGPVHLDSTGAFSQLSIISRVPPDFWGARHLGAYPLRRIEFLTETTADDAHQLVMIQQPLLSVTNGSPKIHRTVLLPRVETFALEVREDTRSITPWEPHWNGTNGLPADARVSLGISEDFPQEKSWPLLASLAQHANPPRGYELIKEINELDFESSGITNSPSTTNPKVVFIIDKSFSMAYRRRFDTAKQIALKSLTNFSDDHFQFNLYTFNSESQRFAPSFSDATQTSLNAATQWLNDQAPILKKGGNDGILTCIKQIFRDSDPTDVYIFADTGFTGKGVGPGEFSDAITSNNKNAKINVFFIAGQKNLNEFMASPRGNEILSVVKKYNGSVSLIGE